MSYGYNNMRSSPSVVGPQVTDALNRWGLTDLWLPFLLIFVVVFAALQKSNLLGTKKKKYNVVVALCISLMTVVPHITRSHPPGYDVVQIMNNAIPQTIVVFMAIIMFLVLVGIFGFEAKQGSLISGISMFIAIIAIVVIFVRAAGGFSHAPWLSGLFNNPDLITVIVVILVFGLIVKFITDEPSGGSGFAGGLKNFFKELQG